MSVEQELVKVCVEKPPMTYAPTLRCSSDQARRAFWMFESSN
jgi:hypothetical protein